MGIPIDGFMGILFWGDSLPHPFTLKINGYSHGDADLYIIYNI